MTIDRLPPADPCGSHASTQGAGPLPWAEGPPRQVGRHDCGRAEQAVPRALAWSCLLPSNSVLRADGSLPWPASTLAVDPGDEQPQVLVGWRRWQQPPQWAELCGAVAINFRRLPAAMLRDAGFDYQRRFAVLPHPGAPRWFIPLDTPRVAAAALQLTMPSRAWLRGVHRAAGTVVRSGWPLWYRHQLCIAMRQPAPLELHLQRVLNLDWLRLAFSAGNVETVRNRKRTLVALDRWGSIRGYAKIPATPVGAQRLRREADVLRQLQRVLPSVAAPRVLDDQQVDGQNVLVTSVLDGRPPGSALTAVHRRFLASLQRGAPRAAADCGWLRRLGGRLESLSTAEADVSVLRAMWPTLQSLTVPPTFYHGDFAPWNLRQQGDSLAAFDWEYGEADALPLLDDCHHLMSVEYFLGSRSLPRLERQLRSMAHSNALGLSTQQIRALQAVYLLDHLCRLSEEGYPRDYPKRLWWQQTLRSVLATMQAQEGSQ